MNCYIYGAGRMYNRIIGRLRMNIGMDVIGIITTELPSSGTLDGFKRLRADDADWSYADYVIIAVENWEPIYQIIKRYDVPNEKIINGKIFELPYFNLTDYLRLKSSNPSIVANTCLAGRVYKELGIRNATPCINAACFDDEGYLDFMRNFKSFTEMDIVPWRSDKKYSGTYNREYFIPKGILGERVVWNFPHEDIEIAVSNWNRRRKRINYENLSYLMVVFSDEGAYAFDELDVKRKLGFYYKDLGLKNVIYTPEWNDPEVQRKYDFNYVMFVHRYATNAEGNGRVDWISFLLGIDTYLRW